MKTEHLLATRVLRSPRITGGALAALLALLVSCAAQAAGAGPPPNVVKISSGNAASATTATLVYLSIPAATFYPFGGGANKMYAAGGCIYQSDGVTEVRYLHKLLLPDGAIVRYVRLYAYDDAPSDWITALFTTYDAAGHYTEWPDIKSSDGGYGSTVSASIDYTVDNRHAPMNIVINLGNTKALLDGQIFRNGFEREDTLRFCGVRVAYEMPI